MKKLNLFGILAFFPLFLFSCSHEDKISSHPASSDDGSDNNGLVNIENQCGVDMLVTYRAYDPKNTSTFLGPLSHNHSIWIPAGKKIPVTWNEVANDETTPIGAPSSGFPDNSMEEDSTSIRAFWLVPNYCPKVSKNDAKDFIKFLNTTYSDPTISHNIPEKFKNGLTYEQNCLYSFSQNSPEFSTKFELTKDGVANEFHSSLDVSYVDGYTMPLDVIPYVTDDETSTTCATATSEKMMYPPLFLKEIGFSKSDVTRQSDLYSDECNYKMNLPQENIYDEEHTKYFLTNLGKLPTDRTLENLHFSIYNKNIDFENSLQKQNVVGCMAPQTRFSMNQSRSQTFANENTFIEKSGTQKDPNTLTFYDSRLIQYICPYNTETLFYYLNHGTFPMGSPEEKMDNDNWNFYLSQWDLDHQLNSASIFPLTHNSEHPGETAFAQIVKGYLHYKFPQYSPQELQQLLTDKTKAKDFIDVNSLAPEICHLGPMGNHNGKTFPWLDIVHKNSLRTYSFSYDDNQGTLSCNSKQTRFHVTLCPGGPRVGH